MVLVAAALETDCPYLQQVMCLHEKVISHHRRQGANPSR